MKQRVITGLIIFGIYAALATLSAYVHPVFFDVFTFLFALFGIFEMDKALSNGMSKPILVIDLVGLVLGFASFWFGHYFFKTYSAGMTGYFISLAVMVIFTVIFTASSKVYVKGNAVSTLFILMYPLTLLMFSMGINALVQFDVGGAVINTAIRNDGIVLLLCVPCLTDMFALFVGLLFKGKKLAPTISPNKTISGAIGGLFGGVFGAMVMFLFAYLGEEFNISIFGLMYINGDFTTTIIHFAILGFFGAIFDQMGDLFASYIKRRTGLKDFSHILPGHGGILDRIDGYMFCGVFFYLYLAVLVLL